MVPAQAGRGHDRGFDEPYTGFAPPNTKLRAASPEEAGLDAGTLTELVDKLKGYMEPQGTAKPIYPGAVVLAGHDGDIVLHEAMGKAVKYADFQGTELPADQQVDMRTDTIFDMASVSKLFTSIVVMQQVERGRIDLDRPVWTYLAPFKKNGKEAVTVRQLLTHTSGLPSWIALWRLYPTIETRIQATLEVAPQAPPDTRYTYSDLNLITLGVLAEQVSGKPLDDLVRDGITEPLGMVDTGYNPPASKLDRIAATEYESAPPRGIVRGSVHDENAWSLGGVAGHAGIFSTASDLAILCQAILNGGRYDRHKILSRESVEAMITNYNQAFPNNSHGLGFELNQIWYMSGLSSPSTAGHTGFTGTSLVIDPLSRTFVVLLTNRVHPSRDWSSATMKFARQTAAQYVAKAVKVTPRKGETAWFSGLVDASTATLTLPVELRSDHTKLTFAQFAETERTDWLTLELSRDGGATWAPVPFEARSKDGDTTAYAGQISGFNGRAWYSVTADLAGPAGPVQLRWRYTTDSLYQGRGVYVDAIKLTDSQGVLVDGEREAERLVAVGFVAATR
jgi:CubicO group peptidase (beta-lactamase class C family)